MSEQSIAEPTSHTYVSQRLKLHYVDWGNPGAPPLLLLHGGRDHCRNWDWVARMLRPEYHIIAPDLRGHGDSQWSHDGSYAITSYVHDLAELIHQLGLAPIKIIAHSLGGGVALRYAGLYPENVDRLVAIEGLRPLPAIEAEPIDERTRRWIEEQRKLSRSVPRRYASIEDALLRMQAANQHLSPDQARHLTLHGLAQNEDGSYSWKFDNHVRSNFPVDVTDDELNHLLSRIACPTLLVYGRESWASSPAEDGRIAHFANARVTMLEDAGHWVHHDRLEAFVAEAKQFLME